MSATDDPTHDDDPVHDNPVHDSPVDVGPDEVLRRVEHHLTGWFGPDTGRAGVTFLGTDPIEILRFGPDPDGVVRYVTLGMAREPMTPPEATVRDPAGPRAELVLSLRGHREGTARVLAVLAAVPVVEGRPMIAGAGLDLGEPLWDGARFTAVLIGEPGGLVPDLELAVGDAARAASAPAPVRFLPLFPMTPNEAAYKRVHGATAMRQRWLDAGTDLRDPDRAEVSLG